MDHGKYLIIHQLSLRFLESLGLIGSGANTSLEYWLKQISVTLLRIKGNGWKFHGKSVMPIGAINNLRFSYWPSGWPSFKWRFCYFMKALISKMLSTQVSLPRTEIDLLNTVVLKVRSTGCWRSDSQVKIIFLIILKFRLPFWTVLQKHWWYKSKGG